MFDIKAAKLLSAHISVKKVTFKSGEMRHIVSAFSECVTPSCSRDAGHEGFNSQLSGQEGGGVRAGETRPAQRPQEPRLYPFSAPAFVQLNSSC